jgi:RHS repeat-associated protein
VYGAGLQYEVNDAGAATYYHYDQSGNTAALTNQAGAIIERVVYSPYGTIRYRQSNFDTPFLYGGFFGVMTDANGLINMRARYYNPLTMRFLNSDPAMDGLNWYAYANGNPISNSDPGGLSTVRIITDQGLTTLIDPTNQKFRDTVTAFSNGSINKIEIVGHGSSEQMYIEPGSSGHGVVYVQGVTQGIVFTDDGTSLSGLLKPKLSVDANIQLNGCNTAREWTSSSNENIAKQLSHELPGVSVTGNRGFGIGNEMSNPLNRDQYIRFGQENHAVGITRTYKTNK